MLNECFVIMYAHALFVSRSCVSSNMSCISRGILQVFYFNVLLLSNDISYHHVMY